MFIIYVLSGIKVFRRQRRKKNLTVPLWWLPPGAPHALYFCREIHVKRPKLSQNKRIGSITPGSWGGTSVTPGPPCSSMLMQVWKIFINFDHSLNPIYGISETKYFRKSLSLRRIYISKKKSSCNTYIFQGVGIVNKLSELLTIKLLT